MRATECEWTDYLAESAGDDKDGTMNTVGWFLAGMDVAPPPGPGPFPADDAAGGSPVAWIIIIVSALAAIAAIVTLVIMKTKSANRGPYGYPVGPAMQQGSEPPPSAQSGPGYGAPLGHAQDAGPGQPGQQPPNGWNGQPGPAQPGPGQQSPNGWNGQPGPGQPGQQPPNGWNGQQYPGNPPA